MLCRLICWLLTYSKGLSTNTKGLSVRWPNRSADKTGKSIRWPNRSTDKIEWSIRWLNRWTICIEERTTIYEWLSMNKKMIKLNILSYSLTYKGRLFVCYVHLRSYLQSGVIFRDAPSEVRYQFIDFGRDKMLIFELLYRLEWSIEMSLSPPSLIFFFFFSFAP